VSRRTHMRTPCTQTQHLLALLSPKSMSTSRSLASAAAMNGVLRKCKRTHNNANTVRAHTHAHSISTPSGGDVVCRAMMRITMPAVTGSCNSRGLRACACEHAPIQVYTPHTATRQHTHNMMPATQQTPQFHAHLMPIDLKNCRHVGGMLRMSNAPYTPTAHIK
jgi:hypothetical protein